jgi:hypothetical protein
MTETTADRIPVSQRIDSRVANPRCAKMQPTKASCF